MNKGKKGGKKDRKGKTHGKGRKDRKGGNIGSKKGKGMKIAKRH